MEPWVITAGVFIWVKIMNDFTKEELVAILSSLMGNSYYFRPPHMHPLLLKIQSMIDAYCEDSFVNDLTKMVNKCE